MEVHYLHFVPLPSSCIFFVFLFRGAGKDGEHPWERAIRSTLETRGSLLLETVGQHKVRLIHSTGVFYTSDYVLCISIANVQGNFTDSLKPLMSTTLSNQPPVCMVPVGTCVLE